MHEKSFETITRQTRSVEIVLNFITNIRSYGFTKFHFFEDSLQRARRIIQHLPSHTVALGNWPRFPMQMGLNQRKRVSELSDNGTIVSIR